MILKNLRKTQNTFLQVLQVKYLMKIKLKNNNR